MAFLDTALVFIIVTLIILTIIAKIMNQKITELLADFRDFILETQEKVNE